MSSPSCSHTDTPEGFNEWIDALAEEGACVEYAQHVQALLADLQRLEAALRRIQAETHGPHGVARLARIDGIAMAALAALQREKPQ